MAAATGRAITTSWSHKFEVEFSRTRGQVRFPSAVATLEASADALMVTVETSDPDAIDQLKDVVTRHLDRFAFREAPLPFEWLATEDRK